MAEEAAAKIHKRTSAAKASPENKDFNAALEALLHPKPEFSRSLCRALPNHFGFSGAAGSRALSKLVLGNAIELCAPADSRGRLSPHGTTS